MYRPTMMPVFSTELENILNNLPGRIIQVSPRRPFRDPFTVGDDFILVRWGLLSLYRNNGQGGRQIVSLRYPREEIIAPEAQPTYGIEALVPSELLVVTREDFEALLARHSAFEHLFNRRAQRYAAISYEWLLNNGRRDAVSRIAHLLCETVIRSHSETNGHGMLLPFTQQHIADITGQTTVNVSRLLGRLEEMQLIKRQGRRIKFLNWPELQHVAGFWPNYLQ